MIKLLSTKPFKLAAASIATCAAMAIAGYQIIDHEGVVATPYKDSVGVLTVGIGRNLERELSKDEILCLYENDLKESKRIAEKFAGNVWDTLSPERQAVLINMAFNLGETRLFKFKNTRKAVLNGNDPRVISGMRNSLWCRQVKKRCSELVKQWETGKWQ